MNLRKLFSVFLLSILVVSFSIFLFHPIPKVYAYDYNLEFAHFGADTGLVGLVAVHPAVGMTVSASATSFNTTSGFKLGYVKHRLFKQGSPTVNISAALYDDNSGVPGNYLANSTAMNSSDLTTSSAWYNFNFTAEDYTLSASTKYWLDIEVNDDGGTVDGSNCPTVRLTDNNTDDYDRKSYYSSAWQSTSNSYDMQFYIYSVAGPQDLYFTQFENLLSKTYRLMNKEHLFSSSEILAILSSSSRTIEVSRTLFESIRLWASHTEVFERLGLDLVFTLFENLRIFNSLNLGRELSFSFSELISFYGYSTSVFEGVALDLSFILFETIVLQNAALFTPEIAIVIEYATKGFVLAVILAGVFIITPLIALIVRRR